MPTQSISMPFTTVATSSTSDVFIPVTQFMATLGIERLRAVFELRGVEGTLAVRPAYQLANEITEPEDAYGLGTGQTSNGYYFPSDYEDPSTQTDNVKNKQLIRFGWLVKVTSGMGLGRVAGSIQVVHAG